MSLIISVSNVTGCHIPPLGDEELVALLRATNDNDVDNGLSSWIGRCCKRKRVPKQATPEVGIINRTLRDMTSVQGFKGLHSLTSFCICCGSEATPIALCICSSQSQYGHQPYSRGWDEFIIRSEAPPSSVGSNNTSKRRDNTPNTE